MKAMTPNSVYANDYIRGVALSEQDFQESTGYEKVNRRQSRRNLLILSIVYFALLAYFIL